MTELEVRRPGPATGTLPARIHYARELAASGLLPAAYRRNPPNVLWAMEYGDMLGLSHMAAITGVHVIEGKPTASAGLISALVRRAGHRLRVRGDSKSATCQIIRADDPDYTFEVTWTLRRNTDDNPSAEEAQLLNKQVWKQYPASMLKSRAITQCARDACEEALFGLHYTPEELGADVDEDGAVLGEIVDETSAGQAAAPGPDSGPDEDPWVVHPDPDADPEWDAKVAQMSSFGTDDEGRKLWAAILARRDERKITPAEANRLKVIVRHRWKELAEKARPAEPVSGTVVPSLDAADPWAARVEEISSVDDAGAIASEVSDAVSAGEVDDHKAAAIFAAISVKEASLTERSAA